MSSDTVKIERIELEDVHPKAFFGDDWLDYASQIKQAKTAEDLVDVLFEIKKKHHITVGDILFVFAKVLFSEKTFKRLRQERDMFVIWSVFQELKKSNQE